MYISKQTIAFTATFHKFCKFDDDGCVHCLR